MDFLAQQATARRKAREYRFLFVICALAGLPILCLTVAILLSFVTLAVHTIIAGVLNWDASSAGLMPLRPFVAIFPGSWRSFSDPSVQVWAAIDVLATFSLVGLLFYKLHKVYRTSSYEFFAGEIGAMELLNGEEDLEEQQLVNIVGEMSLASGIAPPRVFTWGETAGINAFSNGDTAAAAEVYVSRGALEVLNREETQALVAHEISRIANADKGVLMRMFGATFLSYGSLRIARRMLRFPKRSEWLDHWFLTMIRWVLWIVYLPFAMVLWGTGSLQYLISWVFTSAVMRQQINAADAFALQFTRNPVAIKNLLMKVAAYGGDVGGNEGSAESLEHVCFASLTQRRWFNTHPSIPSRLKALDPRYRAEELAEFRERIASKQKLLEIETLNAEAARLARERQRKRVSEVVKNAAAPSLSLEATFETNEPGSSTFRPVPDLNDR